jgi:hypothetical protein
MEDFKIIISKDFKVTKATLNANIKPIQKKILYIIECRYERSSLKHTFYNYSIYDNLYRRVKNNTMLIEGFNCKLCEKDYWGNPFGNTNYLLISFLLEDTIGEVKLLAFKNEKHNKTPFQYALIYLGVLIQEKKHRLVEKYSHNYTEYQKISFL